MIIPDIKYQKVEKFLASMKLDAYYIRKILKENLNWEKDFLIQRAKEEKIPYMEEYLDNFNTIRPKIGGKALGEKRRIAILDTETEITYTSYFQAQSEMKIPYSRVMKFLETGRFKKLIKLKYWREKMQIIKMFKYVTNTYHFYLDKIESKNESGTVAERCWVLNRVNVKKIEGNKLILSENDFHPPIILPLRSSKVEIEEKIKSLSGCKEFQLLCYDSESKKYI